MCNTIKIMIINSCIYIMSLYSFFTINIILYFDFLNIYI
uniref:Uncharacterized protein n=1 Tax=Herposiphonia versicolor TaxID=2007163 RepID=A0A1Z1MFG1_9FLOR|nr:hypothetical protein [Herposiphonia versicolor]ARW64723.1 hypothetical protein [Herposiphonia versicolor]